MKFRESYAQSPQIVKIIDSFLIFTILTGVTQFLYMMFVVLSAAVLYDDSIGCDGLRWALMFSTSGAARAVQLRLGPTRSSSLPLRASQSPTATLEARRQA